MQKISPFLWFEDNAKEAAAFYASVFGENARTVSERSMEGTPSGSVDIIELELFGQSFTLMKAGPFVKFNEAISFVISCDTQEEIDKYWSALSAVPEAEQCGWLKDKYGVSWQVVPANQSRFFSGTDPEAAARATKAMLQMKKLDIAALQKAYDGA